MKYKIEEINDIKIEDYNGIVYDLEVEEDHSYSVNNGILVHNSVCETRKNTGVGVPQLTALKEIRKAIFDNKLDIKVIADGGIQYFGDVPKAMVFADAVMVGSMISGTSETPGHVYQDDEGKFYKTYGGSSSGENKVKNGEMNRFVEGMVKTVQFRGHVKYILHKIEDGLRSALSYSGAWNIKEFHEKAILREISGGGRKESKI